MKAYHSHLPRTNKKKTKQNWAELIQIFLFRFIQSAQSENRGTRKKKIKSSNNNQMVREPELTDERWEGDEMSQI